MRRAMLFVVMFVLLAGCGPAQTINVPVTVLVNAPMTVPVTVPVTVEVVSRVTVLVRPTALPKPTATPTLKPEEVPAIAANFITSQTQGGMVITMSRVLCGDGAYFREKAKLSGDKFETVATACEFVLEVYNGSDKLLRVYPDQGQVIIGDEQVEPMDYFASIGNMEDISGDFYPGVRRIGGFWLGLKRITWDQIKQVTFIVNAPTDSDFNRQGDQFYFEISCEGWGYEPFPEELQP
jgi:hypothetical protein